MTNCNVFQIYAPIGTFQRDKTEKAGILVTCLSNGFKVRKAFHIQREKGRDLTQSYDKSPYTHRKIQKTTWQHKNATKCFDNTTIADRLRTVSWSNRNESTKKEVMSVTLALITEFKCEQINKIRDDTFCLGCIVDTFLMVTLIFNLEIRIFNVKFIAVTEDIIKSSWH